MGTHFIHQELIGSREVGVIYYVVKGILHPKMKIRSSFMHPQVVANMNEFLSSAEDILKNDWNIGTIDFHSI